jgi:hypothetical protein
MMLDDVVRATTLLLAIAALLAGCGGHAPIVRQESAGDEWMANARGVVEQLRGDVIAVAGYDRVAAARAGLDDDSQLYGLLVSYTDFGGCLHMAAAVGAAPPGRARVVRLLRRACAHLRRADALFTRAVARSEPPLLVRATREAVAAVPVLDAAGLVLAHKT